MTRDRERMPRYATTEGSILDIYRKPYADPGGNRAQRRLAAKAKRLRDKRQAKAAS